MAKMTGEHLISTSDRLMKHLFISMIAVSGFTLLFPVFAGDDAISDTEVVTVKSPMEIESVQKLPYFVGISADTAGSRVLSMRTW